MKNYPTSSLRIAGLFPPAPRPNRQLMDLVRKNFHDRLQAKTGWGRNDVMAEFDKAVNDALLELLDNA